MIDDKQLDEAHKVGDKVIIVKGPKDAKGKEGRIGEIRKHVYKGASKTYTVDYDHHETTGERKSIQLQAKHIKGVKEQVENLQEKHRVAVTLSDPHHPAVTKRKELIQKTVRVKADNPGHAVDSAIHHFRRAGYKVHDHHYIGTVKEGAMPTFKELDESALEKFRKAAAEREKEANKREAEMKARHASGKEDMKGAIDTLAKKLNKEEVELDEISKELAGNYVGALAKKQLDKHGMKPNMYDKLPAKHKKGFDRAIDRLKEESELEEGTFKYHMDKAVAAHDRGDVNRKKFHLSNAKQARYALKSTEITKHKDLLDKYKSMTEDTNLEEGRGTADKHWNIAQGHKEKADIAHDKASRHAHLADYHDSMSRYHDEMGNHTLAQSHADKADINHEKSLEKNEDTQLEENWIVHKDGKIIKKFKTHTGAKAHAEKHGAKVNSSEYYHDNIHKKLGEDAPVNSVGGGNIAGTQGDAGKKAVITKKPLKRQTFKQFTEAAVDAKGHKSSTGGLTQKGRDYYNNKTGGHLQAPVTTKPSKLDPDSKAAKRRKSFCARMGGMPGPMKDEKGRPTRKALALRKWNC